jgi:hypothetical protein
MVYFIISPMILEFFCKILFLSNAEPAQLFIVSYTKIKIVIGCFWAHMYVSNTFFENVYSFGCVIDVLQNLISNISFFRIL